MDVSNTLIGEEKELTGTYKRRWAIVLAVLMYNMGVGFGRSYFGQVNDVYALYYGVSLADTDWLTVVYSPSALASCIVIAWLASTRTVGLRKLCLVQCGLIAMAFSAQLIAVLSQLFPIAILGEFILGFPASIGMVSTQLVAVTWFPPKETGIAMGLHWAGMSIGFTLGFFVPSRVLRTGAVDEDVESLEHDTRKTSACVFGSACALFYLLFVITYFIVENKPSLPPGNAEMMKRETKRRESNGGMKEKASKLREACMSFRDFLSMTWSLVCDRTYVIAVVAFGLACSNDSILFALMSDVVSSRGGALTGLRSAEETSGIAMSLFGLGHLVGGIVGGKLLDHTKRYKILACVLLGCDFFATITIFLSILLAKFPLLCVGTMFFGIGTMSSLIAVSELACQHMYPTNELLLSAWLVVSGQVLGIVFPLLLRVVLTNFGYLPTVAIQSSLLGVGLIILMLTKPRYHRLRANSMKPGGDQSISA